MKELLLKYTNYNLWANTKLTGFLKNIKPELLDKELLSSFSTIRKTVYHIWDAEQIWYNRLSGTSLTDWPSESFNGSFDGFVELFTGQSQLFIDFVQSKSEAELTQDFEYKSMEGKPNKNPVCDTVLHCMNHSTFHRGQLITMLRNLGHTELSSTDFITFIRETA
ncbi:MAG: DinB family protein [Chlorobi bacterium]|nr:DinB family protein [Chlorobiota bacterium]MCI0715214.1 DinB family protein [Chlorobiota bacterium]